MSEHFLLVDSEGDILIDVALPVWTRDAACASNGHRLEDFFVEEAHRNATELTLAAKRCCAGCSVRPECLTWALTNEAKAIYRDGIFGGLSPSERIFATQHAQPLAFGLSILDEQVASGEVTSPVPRYEEVHDVVECGTE